MTELPPASPPPSALDGKDLIAALLIALLSGALYLATLQPDLGGPEDTPKFQFLGYVLGTAHPPGYPLYSMLSHVFVQLPIRTIAYRANLFSALMAVFTCTLVFVIARLLGSSRWAAACAALGLATGASFWRSAVFAEVYSLAAAGAAASLALLLLWGRRGRVGWLLGAVAATSLAFGNHLTIVGVVPAYVLYVLLRDRRVITLRFVAAAAMLVLLGAAQYGFIILRTRQGAPYLESRATTLAELSDVMLARRFEKQRFAFTWRTVLTVQAPVVLKTIGQDLRPLGIVLVILGLGTALRRAKSAALLVAGAGAGMLGMVLNLGGDIKGFITPILVFVWPFAAVGADALRAPFAHRRVLVAAAAGVAAVLPLANVTLNYKDADQSGQWENAAFFRALHAQLPAGASVVTEDYFYDMTLYYFRFTGEAPGSAHLTPVSFDASAVRAAAGSGGAGAAPRPVFAFAGGATFLAVEGLQFVPTTIYGPPLEQWLARLPRGTILVGASAYTPGPLDLSALGHSQTRPQGRAQNFEAFAIVAGKPGGSWGKNLVATTVVVDSATLGTRLPSFGGTLRTTADELGARIEIEGRSVAYRRTGLVLAAFSPEGVLMRVLEFPAAGPWRVPFAASVYQLNGEAPCTTVADGWTDVTPEFSSGSAVATLHQLGTFVVETTDDGDGEASLQSAGILGDAEGQDLAISPAAKGARVWRSALTRSGGRRSVFRLAVDRPGLRMRARVASGPAPSVRLCSQRPIPLFRDGSDVDAIHANFEAEAYFGPGWSGAAPDSIGRVRKGKPRATLLLPLESGHAYRMTLDLMAPHAAHIGFALNGADAGSCVGGQPTPCVVELRPDANAGAVSAVTVVTEVPPGGDAGAPIVTFRGARIERTRESAFR